MMLTVGGLQRCTVPEFKKEEYRGLRSGIGGTRKSSKHYRCKKECCVGNKRQTVR